MNNWYKVTIVVLLVLVVLLAMFNFWNTARLSRSIDELQAENIQLQARYLRVPMNERPHGNAGESMQSP